MLASGIAAASHGLQPPEKVKVVGAAAVEEVRRRNRELEEELRRSRESEEEARRELERARERLRVAEEAEERLCAQLGELEAEALGDARAYLLQIHSLTEQLSRAGQQLHHQPPAVPLRGRW